jgi:hypothetical protein
MHCLYVFLMGYILLVPHMAGILTGRPVPESMFGVMNAQSPYVYCVHVSDSVKGKTVGEL